MTLGLEDYGSCAVGQVGTRLVVRKGAIGNKNVCGSGISEEGEPTTRDDGTVQTLERDLTIVIGSGGKVMVVNELRVE